MAPISTINFVPNLAGSPRIRNAFFVRKSLHPIKLYFGGAFNEISLSESQIFIHLRNWLSRRCKGVLCSGECLEGTVFRFF